MKNIFLLSAFIIFTGCGGSGSGSSGSSSAPAEDQNDVNMTIGTTYTVYSGDKLVKTDLTSLVEINHVGDSKTSTVRLLEGSANIIRK